MISRVIVTDNGMVKDGKPIEGADIYHDHVRVHPDFAEKTKKGLEEMFGKECVVVSYEEYISGTFGRN